MAERQSKGEILALEEELEREREDASRTFEGVQRRLKEAGADPRLREETERRLVQDTEQIQQELEELEEAAHREPEIRAEARSEAEKRVRQDVEREIAERIQEIRSGAERSAESELQIREQRRLDELVEEIDAAGRHVEEAEARLAAKTQRLQRESAERRESEARHAEVRLEAAVERAREETAVRLGQETDARLAAQAEHLHAEADKRVRETAERAAEGIEKAQQRAMAAEQRAAEAEQARRDREMDARSSAAAWLRGQAGAIEAKAERAADRRIRIEVARARREIEAEGERRFAEEAADPKEQDREEARYRELRNRIGSVRQKERSAERAERKQAARPAKPDAPPMVDVNQATFEQLRQLGLSVTQATRVIAYRQRQDGFDSVDELDTVPGFPKSFLEELKDRLSA